MSITLWKPEPDVILHQALGKLAEECSELAKALIRGMIQGYAEEEPVTGKLNRTQIMEEAADVKAALRWLFDVLDEPFKGESERERRKFDGFKHWQAMLVADLSATPAPGPRLRVKPLDWKLKPGTSDIFAETPVGTYGVGLVQLKMIATVRRIVNDQWEDCVFARGGLEEVKLAAQRHYEDAILSAIIPPPQTNLMGPDGRLGDWMQTVSGRQFWPLDPRPEDIVIEDIAHGLSMMCRFGGHCERFYSVAEHSVLVSENVPPQDALWALLHDASEAYIADIVRPAKRFIGGYKQMEVNIMAAVCGAFDLPIVEPPSVKRADNAILADEAAQIMGAKPKDWILPEPPLGVRIIGLSPAGAKLAFLNRYRALTTEGQP